MPVGEGPAGATGGGSAADLEPDRRGDGLARVTRPCALIPRADAAAAHASIYPSRPGRTYSSHLAGSSSSSSWDALPPPSRVVFGRSSTVRVAIHERGSRGTHAEGRFPRVSAGRRRVAEYVAELMDQTTKVNRVLPSEAVRY